MSRPLLFQKRGKRTLVVASRYNSINSIKASSKKNLSSKENISPEPFKPSNSLSSSLTHKFANLKLDMHSDSDCEVIEINSVDKSQKVTRDPFSKNTYTMNNKFRRPSPKPELPKEKARNLQRSFRRPSPKTNRFSEFRRPSPKSNKFSEFRRSSQNIRASSPQFIDLTKDYQETTPKKYRNGFRAPSPTKGRYINLPKLDLLSDEGTPEPNDMHRNRKDSADLKKKCPYCNETLPDPLPPRIRAYLESPSKMPSSSLIAGHSSNIVDQFEFCRLHDAESHIVPDGLQKNYPLVIDFNILPNRIKTLFPELLEVATGKIKSLFRDLAMDAYNELGKARARKPTVVMGRFQKFLPGYYGSKGSSVIFSTLVSLFIESKRLTLDMTKPQEPLEYLNQVLVPETAIRLIAQDRGGITLREARKIMEDSREFGMYVHDVEEEDI
ncbi:RTC4-like domain-containing protein [Gigaspora rosea]|uniref:Restriction of telomere capping protein 4 n=1 Tax=Gigaspora rosea TaxID=44941 RepID=A0A397TVB8_9GLOM|nr:RTC4-like domain-containing protein [Gigaspora rosea]